MAWLTKNYRIIVIALLTIISIPILIMFWFYTNLYLMWNSNNFNNILTPILTAATTVLLFLVARRQNQLLTNQNEFILSQNIKPEYEQAIEELDQYFDTVIPAYKVLNPNPEQAFPEVTIRNLMPTIRTVLMRLIDNPNYLTDIVEYGSGTRHTREYFRNRSYYGDILFLGGLTMGIPNYDEVEELITSIVNSKVQHDEKMLMLARIKRKFVSDYMQFFGPVYRLAPFDIPILFTVHNNNSNIEFQRFFDTKFNSHYEFFKKHLG